VILELEAFFSALGKWLGNHIAPIATFTAALVALFKEDIVKRWRRPKFTLRLLLRSPDSGTVPTVVMWREPADQEVKKWEGDVYYFRLWVGNEGPWHAERVQVYIRSISNRLGDRRLAARGNSKSRLKTTVSRLVLGVPKPSTGRQEGLAAPLCASPFPAMARMVGTVTITTGC
jgi:hypothetical protein